MLVHHADPQFDGVLRPADAHPLAVVEHVAGVGRDETVDHVHERGLASPVLTQKSVDLTPFDGQVHPIVGAQLSVGFDNPAELERRPALCAGYYAVTPVFKVPFASWLCKSVILAFTSAGIFESKSWYGEMPTPPVDASNVIR